jgi:tetratricopeptide (TPR) repeat protein
MARKGYAPAQFRLGLIYVKGDGVPKDYREALKWYRKAADQGNTAAQRSLGVMFGEGLGVPQDYAEALKWFRRAAEQNDAAAQTNLGIMYDFGHGVVRDYGNFQLDNCSGRNHHSLAHLSKFTLSRAGARSRPAVRSHAAVGNRAILAAIRRRGSKPAELISSTAARRRVYDV